MSKQEKESKWSKIDKKAVIFAAIGTILLELVDGLGGPLNEWLVFESGFSISWINFFIGFYSAIDNSLGFIIILIFGVLGADDLKKLNETRKEQKAIRQETIKNMDDQEGKEVIEAQQRGITVEELREKKYGDPNYWETKRAKEAQEAKQAELEAKRLELAKQEAAMKIETEALKPKPATKSDGMPEPTEVKPNEPNQ